MAIARSVLAIIARRNPAIWEEIIGPMGPLRTIDLVALNPQPLPPVARRFEAVGLNPQPLPPSPAQYGALVGLELMRTAAIAHRLKVSFELDPDEICPPFPRPPIPWPPLPWPAGRESAQDDEWVFSYIAGLAAALETTAGGWEHLDGAAAMERLHEAVLDRIERPVG